MRRFTLLGCTVALAALHCGQKEGPAVGQPEPAALATSTHALQVRIPTENVGVEIRGAGRGLLARFGEGTEVRASVVLPHTASGAFTVTDASRGAGTSVSAKLRGARDVAARVDGGLVKYASALGEGTEAMHRTTPSGTEDYVRFERAPARAELDYDVTLGGDVAGLRLIGDSLEMLDASGSPRLRIDTPYGVDAKGERFDVRLAVQGCAVDRNPAAPWGRPTVDPGGRSCTVHLSWGSDVAYPATVDPAWTAASDMAANNVDWESFLVKNSGGKVLTVVAPGNVAQLYDAAAGTWANTGVPKFGLGHRTRLIALPGDKAWAVNNGGASQIYDVATGEWTLKNSVGAIDGNGVAIIYIGNGHGMVFDSAGRVYDYDIANDGYTAKTSAGRFIGGNLGAFSLGGTKIGFIGFSTNKVAIYDTATDGWTFPNSNVLTGGAENCGNMLLLTSGKALAYGACGTSNQATVFDFANDTLTPVAMDNTANIWCQCAHTSHVSYGKVHRIAGGRYVYDENTGLITDSGAFPSGVLQHGAIVKLDDGRAVAAGGSNNYTGKTTDVLGPSESADCGGTLFGTAATPSYDGASKTCKACDGDNTGVTALKCATGAKPACQTGAQNPLLGQCTECSATNRALCTGTKATCDLTTGACAACTAGNGVANAVRACPTTASPVCKNDGSCVVANGDNGTAATQPCPTAANPFQKADGSCGKCATNADCAGASHGGPICNVAAGSCGTVCAADADCASGNFCDTAAQPKACTPKKAAGATCAAATECTSGSCTGGKCDTACAAAADCAAGTYCDTTAKICKAKVEDGKPCTSADQCTSGSCTNGACGKPASAADAGTSSSSSSSSSSGSVADSGTGTGTGTSTDEGGCTVSRRGTTQGTAGLFGLAAVLGLALRRRRRAA